MGILSQDFFLVFTKTFPKSSPVQRNNGIRKFRLSYREQDEKKYRGKGYRSRKLCEWM